MDNVCVNDLLNFDLSTAKAPPAGTENLSAVCIIKELKVLNSSCKSPEALSECKAPNYYYRLILQIHSYDELESNEEASFQLILQLLQNLLSAKQPHSQQVQLLLRLLLFQSIKINPFPKSLY